MSSRCWLQVVLLVGLLILPASGGFAAEPDDGLRDVEQYVARGEFGVAKERASGLPPESRDAALAEVALAQTLTGDRPASALTLSQIDSPSARRRVLDQSPGNGAGGGGALADFGSLIELIQTTVNPDTWDALGGPSTIREYPQGVFVDPNGLLQNCETLPTTDQDNNLSVLLQSVQREPGAQVREGDWRGPAGLRCVSLRRLRDAWAEAALVGGVDTTAMTHLAGLSSIEYVIFSADDILVAGPIGGIESHRGWYRDQQTGRAAIRFDILATTIGAARSKQAFGCTIDPTRQGLQQAATVASQVQSKQIPIGQAADALAKAIGRQNIEVFGTQSDTALALMMVEADRHMKELALGVHPMPAAVPNYLDIVDAHLERGLPQDLLLRLWFTARPREVRAGPNGEVFELAGTPIRLSGQNERALASGERGKVTRDFRSEEFVTQFNKNWSQIRAEYPIYAGLESVYQAASLAAIAAKHSPASHERLLDSLAALPSTFPVVGAVPRQVETIAVLHRARHGRTRHNVVVASGGVSVRPSQTLTSTPQSYPPLGSLTEVDGLKSKVVQAWWWNAR